MVFVGIQLFLCWVTFLKVMTYLLINIWQGEQWKRPELSLAGFPILCYLKKAYYCNFLLSWNEDDYINVD